MITNCARAARPAKTGASLSPTPVDTNTGGRVKRVEQYIGDDETFCATYGDGLANIDLRALLEFHHSHGRIATLTAVHPRSNFGLLKLDDESAVTEFEEKPVIADWINGGFFVFNRKVFDYLDATARSNASLSGGWRANGN